MRRLEESARPFLQPLLLGQAQTLTPDQQRVVATWAFKTVLMLQFLVRSGPKSQLVPLDQYAYLREHGEPAPGVKVWLAPYVHGPGPANVVSVADHGLTAQPDGQPCIDIFGICCVLGNLTMVVFGNNERVEINYDHGLVAESLTQVWPTGPLLEWPTKIALDAKAFDYFNERYASLPAAPAGA